jgi:hypothetical protein
MQPHWRRWIFPGIYAVAITIAIVLRGDDPIAGAVYRITLPWSMAAYGAASDAFGWTVLVVGALLNGGIAWYIGYHLDERRDHSKGAV